MTISLPGSVRIRPHAKGGFIDVGASAAAAAPFDPLTLSPVLWLKADAGTSTTTDGVGVSSWADQSGSSRNATQATAGSRPLYKAAIQNGLPVLRFDGADDFMDTVAFTQAQPDTIFMVWIDRHSGAGNTVLFDGVANRQNVYALSNGTMIWAATGDVAFTSIGAVVTDGVYLQTLVFNGASGSARFNGVDVSSPPSPGTGSLSGGFRLAANVVPNAYGQIDLGEVLIYGGAMSAPNRTSVETYLKAKWGTP